MLQTILEVWKRWHDELPALKDHLIPRHYFRDLGDVKSIQLHGFSDTSESAYAGVVYLRSNGTNGSICTSIVITKTKVPPIRRITIPRLELCGALVVAKLLHHCREVLEVPLNDTFAWTDSTMVLSWIRGNLNQSKPFVGNRVVEIMVMISPKQWNHVPGMTNQADCASRGLYPSELANHTLWWEGPSWLLLPSDNCPAMLELKSGLMPEEEREVTLEKALLTIPVDDSLLERVSSLSRLWRIMAWIYHFAHNCRAERKGQMQRQGFLTTKELAKAEEFWMKTVQQDAFVEEMTTLKSGRELSGSKLSPLRPFLDQHGLLHVGGRLGLSQQPYARCHLVILPGIHLLTTLIIRSEHLRLLHAGPTLVMASLAQCYHVIRALRVVRAITRECVTCRRTSGKPRPQLMGQLPRERLTPGLIFHQMGVD